MKRSHDTSLSPKSGAKKRKFTKETTTSDNREPSPTDSGFKDQSTSSINLDTASATKKSQRIKQRVLKEDEFSATEKILKNYLTSQQLVKPLETVRNAMSRYLPKVILCHRCISFVNREHLDKLELSHMIPRLPAIDEIEFYGVILHKRETLDGADAHYFVRWIPFNILDDEFVKCDLAGSTKLKKKVRVSEMTFRQKQSVTEMITKGVIKGTD